MPGRDRPGAGHDVRGQGGRVRVTDPADQTETLAGHVERTTALPAAPPVVLGGRYELTQRVASGGMATVWLGRDEVLARQVAVKLLHDHLAADEAFRERFRREAVAAAKLSHPNVVNLYDTGTDGDRVYLVMEFVEGRRCATSSPTAARWTSGTRPPSARRSPARWTTPTSVAWSTVTSSRPTSSSATTGP